MRLLLQATLPLPPSINHAYQIVGGRRRLAATPELDAWKQEAGWLLRDAVRQLPALSIPPRHPWGWSGRFYFPDHRKDLDGPYKFVQDVLADTIGVNDRWMVQDAHEKHVDPSRPRCEITVGLIEGWAYAPKDRRATRLAG